MIDAPERIWIEDEFGYEHEDRWTYGSWDCRNVYDYVHEYIRADLAFPQWQPIETAPRDGMGVLLWWPHWWFNAHPGYWRDYQWHSDKALTPWFEDNENGDPGPLAWMPLPEPPVKVTEQD